MSTDAYEAVRILDRIAKARREYMTRCGKSPDVLYLGYDEYRDLRREAYALQLFPYSAPKQERFLWDGLAVFWVDAASHFHLARLDGR